MNAEEAFRKMNSDGYEEAYIKYAPSGCRIGNTEGKNTPESLMAKMYPDLSLRSLNSPKKEKIRQIYEDDDFIIDLFTDEPIVRVSIFKDNHFVDEVFVRKAEYCMYGGVV